MIAGIDDAMRRPQQLLTRVAADLAKAVIHIGNHTAHIGNGHDQNIVHNIGPEIRILVGQRAQAVIVLE